ncbi:MAG: hypothetical protein BMS9Abin34_341 [Patescibacteria group bacterium]|nr:MAG: hypothetical protein BMS9Abin34_341 [Patescibacteria group bacterium]
MDEITVSTGLAGWRVRRLLRKHIRKLNQVVGGSTDLLCEKVICEQLLKHGRVDLSFAGEAHDMRRAFYAVKRILG